MHRSFRNEDVPLIPSNDPTLPPFGAFAPTRAQASIIALAHRTGIKRGVFRPWLSRLIDLIRKGEIRKGEKVVFLHTGGAVGLFGYQGVFEQAMGV